MDSLSLSVASSTQFQQQLLVVSGRVALKTHTFVSCGEKSGNPVSASFIGSIRAKWTGLLMSVCECAGVCVCACECSEVNPHPQ